MALKNTENELSRRSKVMDIPSQYDNVDYGKKKRTGMRKVVVRDSATGTVYGSRTIATKESVNNMSFKQYLIEKSSSDLTELPGSIIDEIRKNVRDGAKDTTQQWRDALELTTRAYVVSRVSIPTPDQKAAWRQYEDMISYAVRQLHDVRGRDGKWRITAPLVQESFEDGIEGGKRFFVTIPGHDACEVDAESMDDIIDKLTAKLYRNGARSRVLKRDDTTAELGVFVDDIKQEHIHIRML